MDFLGFHTGCLVATETAVTYPEKVRRIALIDVPAYTPVEREALLSDSAKPYEISPNMTCLAPAWERGITKRVESQGMERSWEMFVETLRHGEEMNAGFHASFTYDVEAHFGAMRHETKIIASQSMLLEPTRRAAKLIPAAQLLERLDINRAVLDEAAETIAQTVLEFLDA